MKQLCYTKWKQIWILLIIGLMLMNTFVYASSSPVLNYSVQAVIPENQHDKKQTFFDLRVSPGDKQTLQVAINNNSDEEITAYVSLNSATTGRNGIVNYKTEGAVDESLIIPITDIAKVVNPELVISPNSTLMADIEVEVPDRNFDGVILGGINVSAQSTAEAAEELTEEGIRLKNEYSYVIALQLSQNDKAVQPDIHLKSVAPGVINYRPAMIMNLQNSEPVLVKGMNVEARLYQGDSSEAYKELVLEGAEMAPNSNGDFVIDWEGAAVQPGEYALSLKVEHDSNVWEWDENVTITSQDANGVNEGSILEDAGAFNWMYILWAFLAALLLLIAFWLGKRYADRDKEEQRKN